MKKNPIFSKSKHLYWEWQCFTFSQISLMSGFIEDSCILLSDSAFNLLQYPTSYIFWRFSLYTCEGMKVKMENAILVWLWKLFWTCERILRILGGPSLSSVKCFCIKEPYAEFTTWSFSKCFMYIRHGSQPKL